MRVPIRFLLASLALILAKGAHAQGPNPMAAIKGDRWAEAQAIAAGFADPVAEKLVLYLRLRAPGAATSAEIADFMKRNPDWPAQAMLERRRQEAIASDPDDAAVLAQCDHAVNLASAMLRCAEAIANAGRTDEANALARKALGRGGRYRRQRGLFLHRWAGIATPEDQWARFERLAWLTTPRPPLVRSPGWSRRTMPPPRLASRQNAMTRRRKPWRAFCRPRCGTIQGWCWTERGFCAGRGGQRMPPRC